MTTFRVKKGKTVEHEGKKYLAGEIVGLSVNQAGTMPWAVEQADQDVGDRLRMVRGEKSQDELAEILGVSRNTVARYERKERSPDSAYLERVCSFFPEIDPAWLLTGEGTPERAESPEKARDLSNEGLGRMEVIRLYEANCRLHNPTAEDLALRSHLTRKLTERISAALVHLVCECGKRLTVYFQAVNPIGVLARESSEWPCPFCKKPHLGPGNVVHVELDETGYYDQEDSGQI